VPCPARRIGVLARYIVITGYVKDVRPYIDRASLVIDPRRYRFGMLNHVLQAMSMEKCVIGTRYSFLAISGIESWKNAIVVQDEHDFRQKIEYLIDSDDQRRRIGKNARELMKSRYTWERIAEQYEIMYLSAIEKLDV